MLTINDTFSEFCLAIDLGVISPNMRTNIVIIIVTTPTPLGPISFTAIDVASADAPMFTILLPINIAPSNLLGFSDSFSTNLAPLIPSSTICLILILLRAIKAVSDIEKNPDIINNITNNIICHV